MVIMKGTLLPRAILLCVVLVVPMGAFAESGEMRVLPFEEAAPGLLIRAMPLSVALPETYELFENQPMWGNYLWTTQSSYDHLQTEGFAAPDEGVFQIRISTSVAYDRTRDEFMCGPECGESAMLSKYEAMGLSDIAVEKHLVNEVPIMLVEAASPSIAGHPASKVYLAFVATLVDTNVVMISYTPATQDDSKGKSVWSVLKDALVRRDANAA